MNNVALVIGYLAILAVFGVALAIAYALADEARRSYRQCRRIERICVGKGKCVPWRAFLRGWRQEFLSSYTTIHVRGFALPFDTRKPVRRDW